MKIIQNSKKVIFILLPILAIILLTNFQNNPKPMLTINNGDYANYWKTIDSLERQGLPKSALEKLLELYELAKTAENPSQIVKTLIYRGKYESQLEEDGLVNAIFKMEKEVESEAFPVKPILQSILAEMYQNYLNQNRWKFQNRTTPVAFENQDIRTWTIDQLIGKSGDLYLAAVEDDKTQQIKLADFDAILQKGKNNLNLRPTLYDFLMHRSIDYFMNEQAHLVQPANNFSVGNAACFGNVKDFIGLKIETQDSTSYKFKTLQLFQKLLAFREHDLMMHYQNPEYLGALIDADLKRMKFVYDNSTLDTKFEAYVSGLEKMATNYAKREWRNMEIGNPISEIKYSFANAYFQKGQNYQPSPNEENPEKWYWKKAYEIAKTVVESDKESYGAKQCQALIKQIEIKNVSIQIEQVNLPNQPFLALVNYRNVAKVYAKVIRMNEDRKDAFEAVVRKAQKRRDQQIIFDYLVKLPAVQTTSFDLPKDDDFRAHTTEINFDGLELGEYAVIISNNAQFKINVGAAGYAFTNVSNIGYWHRKNNNGQDEFTVFNRNTGVPLSNVAANFSTIEYNSILRKNEFSKNPIKILSDKNGFVIAPKFPKKGKNYNNQYKVLFKDGKDTLDLNDQFHNYGRNGQNRKSQITHFFLDRAIYRPNQTIYFKGIAIELDEGRMPSIIANQKVKVTFRDVNYQVVASLDLQTNEYGTFNGTFTTPNSGLLGNMSIQSSIGGNRKNFRVEEYKRPKFDVNFEPIEGSFKFDESVAVTGHAKAFAGNNIDGAKVKYRVVREVRFPWMPWWYWRRGYNPYSREAQEIAIGEMMTDAEGKFKVEFTALPDRSIPAEKKPEFSYRVEADVVDISGETHSNSISVKVGYVALQLDIRIAAEVHTDSLQSIEISTKNLNGEFEAAKGAFLLQKLKAPKQIFVSRYWGKPENQLISKVEFNKDFPHFAYQNEDETQNWVIDNTVLETDFDTENKKEVLLPKTGLSIGQYVLSIQTKDKFGTPVEVKKYFQVFDLKEGRMPVFAVLAHHFDDKNYKPKEAAEIYFKTAEKELPILFEIEKDGKIISRNWLTVKNLHKQVQTIEAADRGNIFYHYSYSKHNRNQNKTQTIRVPWSNKELSFEYSTFRDKLQPGQEEEWAIKIKGPKGEKVAAEMVVGMYDASLDEFAANNWGLNLFPMNYARKRWGERGFNDTSFRFYQGWNKGGSFGSRTYDHLNWFGFAFYQQRFRGNQMARNRSMDGNIAMSAAPMEMEESMAFSADVEMDAAQPAAAGMAGKKRKKLSSADIQNLPTKNINAIASSAAGVSSEPKKDFSQIKVRTNLNETVFFYPNLMTDEEGNVLVKFTMNEALTKWKFLGLAHTKDLKIGTTTKEIVTQKDLMVVPNPPRFFRERDEIEFTAKVVNLSGKELTGNAKLELKNPITTNAIFDKDFETGFTVEAGQSALLAWRFKVPDVTDVSLIEHTVLAQAGGFSDAERSVAPVLSNRMLVTETKPLPVRENSSKIFTLESLQNTDSKSLTHHSMTLEFTSNPAWYAVQALPYLMEYPYNCTEQIFSRYYANSLATTVANSHPKVKAVFDKWRNYEPEALMSNLSKNQELKSALLEETPWVLAAQSEEQQKKSIALLFDLNRMSNEQEIALSKMRERQLANGGWAWFPGGRDSWYISQYLVEGFGHLNKLGVTDITENQATWSMVQKAVRYIDDRIVEDFEKYVEGNDAKDDHLSSMRIHYLYARSFFLENQNSQANVNQNDRTKPKNNIALEGKAKKVFDYYLKQAESFWLKKGMYQEGMLALAFHRMNQVESAVKITKSLNERSLNNEEMGMYWKYNTGYYWYQLPIETHALMIEVFEEVAQDAKAVNDLKVWLLKNKQTNHWKTTKATASAVYALLMNGSQWLAEDTPLTINFPKAKNPKFNQQVLESQKSVEAGTGYFKTKFAAADISKNLATIEVKNDNAVPAWGAMYWQYFEDLDKIKTFEETPLTLKKELFLVTNGDNGEELQLAKDQKLIPGDKLKARIELRVDRDMEYIHMKDMRASGFEPINVLSQYKWQDGLGYYESTRDASTNFFFSRLPKGTYVFEYPLRVIHRGDFSNGITTIQSMYAPEFSSHSEGVRVEVKD